MIVAVYPGTFDPLTRGHEDLVRRAATPVALTFATPEPLPFDLTGRELEVLTLVANGLTSAQIAVALVISAKTVGRHIEHLLGKTGVANRVGLATLAHQHGLLSGLQMQP